MIIVISDFCFIFNIRIFILIFDRYIIFRGYVCMRFAIIVLLTLYDKWDGEKWVTDIEV